MSFFKNLISGSNEETPNIKFGRTREMIKSDEQLRHWEESVVCFEEERYLDSIEHFILYLYEENTDLIHYTKNENEIKFTLIQGSKVVEATADRKWFKASVAIIRPTEFNVGMLRKLLESSYLLTYGRYALLEDNTVSILFDGYVQEASPYKLLYGLKEMSLKADKEDDLLIDEFKNVEHINSSHKIELSVQEKKIKFNYFKEWLNNALSNSNYGNLNKAKFPGSMIYVLLSTLYKIDYLIRPEGKVMEIIESAHKNYFEKNELDLNAKAVNLENICKKLMDISEEQLNQELYLVNHTFPISNLITTQDLAEHIEVEMRAMEWYYNNKYFEVCEHICTYLVANSFFNYTLPRITHSLLHLYFEVVETKYFQSLGYNITYDIQNDIGKTAQKLEKSCRKIIADQLENPEIYDPLIKFNTSSKVDLLISFIQFIQNFHYSK